MEEHSRYGHVEKQVSIPPAMRNFITIPASLLLSTSSVIAQLPTMDLTMVENGNGQLEVRARPDDDFGGLFAALTFTIRWDSAAGVALDTAVLHPAAMDYMPVSSQAPVYYSGGYAYRVYNGFAFSPIVASGPAFLAHHEYPLCTIDILLPGTPFELINDAWTSANNTDYFVSLNGTDKTGVYYLSPTPTIDIRASNNGAGTVDVFVRPNNNFFGTVNQLDLTLRWPATGGATAGAVVQTAPESMYLPVQKSGPETTDAGYVYQRFTGGSSTSLAAAAAGCGWVAGEDRLIMSIPINTTAVVEVANDGWTNQNDGDYFVQLDGHAATGQALGGTLATGGQLMPEGTGHVSISASGSAIMLVSSEQATGVMELYTTDGRLVHSSTVQLVNGTWMSEELLHKGAYLVSLMIGDRRFSRAVALLGR